MTDPVPDRPAGRRGRGCPFCEVAEERLVLATKVAVAFRDAFPVSEGHTLVVPRRHVASVFELDMKELAIVWELVATARAGLLASVSPDGFTVGVNDGAAAGQTVEHAHVHVIPRFEGDIRDPRGGVRWVRPDQAAYWRDR